jgi:hypothetical protein
VPDTTAVCLNTDLQEADIGLLGHGLDAQTGRVGVCANNGDGVARSPVLANGECDDGGAVTGEIVFAAGAEGRRPGVALANESVAGFLEACGGGGDGVVG